MYQSKLLIEIQNAIILTMIKRGVYQYIVRFFEENTKTEIKIKSFFNSLLLFIYNNNYTIYSYFS